MERNQFGVRVLNALDCHILRQEYKYIHIIIILPTCFVRKCEENVVLAKERNTRVAPYSGESLNLAA